ncbi:MAG: hypothetical protein KAH23_05315 [Kiritimatiellae bacterium]|nr:hypothetical protein [Kiritimatiellia bacterium]
MHQTPFMEVINSICTEDQRYQSDAYFFVREALDFTSKTLDKPADGPGKHITGHELLDGMRLYALQEFGPMTMRVLNQWGIHTTADFGEIVFNLVKSKTLGKTEEDKIEDFTNCYDFNDAFVKPFLPRPAPISKTKSAPEHRGQQPRK